ncbi:50S ribosomal protein L11 methyltransferase [Clostridium perfringens]|uniref:50S ribosomal protein L11 methyltransferase n=1 Tax=Clostridium perfringens TaxID=1502 RepID=UPI0039ED3628
MFIITYKMPKELVDEKIELLQINDIFNVYYESPLDITTDMFGYGYKEKENVIVDLKVAFDGNLEDFEKFKSQVSSLLKETPASIDEVKNEFEEFYIDPIHLNDQWVLCAPTDNFENKKEIFFTPQGAFGTGLHETTQDILKFIVEEDFEGKSLLDLGTGSGILSIAAGVKGASKIVAVDIRDVEDEVLLNASLNELENIEVVVGNVLDEEYKLDEKFDWIFINIGGEETAMFMDFIEEHIEKTGKLLVSGLVEWSFDWVKEKVENKGFKLNKKFQTNEWCTAIFSK